LEGKQKKSPDGRGRGRGRDGKGRGRGGKVENPAGKAKSKSSKDAKSNAAEVEPPAKKPRSSNAKEEKVEAVEYNQKKVDRMLAFVASVDPDLEGDDFRQHVRSLLPEWEHVRLNVYWSRNSCGVQLKLEEGYKDIYGGTFSFGRCPGDAFSKKLVAIAAAKMLALCLLYWLFSYLLISMCGLLYWKVLHGFALKVSLFFLCTTTNPGNHRQQAWY